MKYLMNPDDSGKALLILNTSKMFNPQKLSICFDLSYTVISIPSIILPSIDETSGNNQLFDL